jgi:hypothetical protein
MSRIRFALAILLLCANAKAQDAPARSTAVDWFAKDTTGMLEEIVDTFRFNADAYHQQRRVFVAKGSSRELINEETHLRDVYFVAAHDTKARTFFATSKTREARNGTILLEDWRQVLLEDNKLYKRYSPYNGVQEPEVTLDEDEQERIFSRFVRYDPVLQAVCATVYSRVNGAPMNADASLTAGELISSEFDKDGNVIVFSRIPLQQSVWQFVYGKQEGYMPICFTIWNQNGEKRKLHSRVQTQWKKIEDVWVPMQQQLVDFNPGRENELELELVVMLENQLQGVTIVDSADADWRERIRVLFEEDWQRAGVFPPQLVRQ